MEYALAGARECRSASRDVILSAEGVLDRRFHGDPGINESEDLGQNKNQALELTHL